MSNTAFVFPGQGSQSVGMLSDLAVEYPLIRALCSEASEVVGYDLWQLIQAGPEEQLNQTECTQVAMLVADVALYRVLMQQGVAAPLIMAGHSLGEYAALVCAESLTFTEGVRLVAQRGKIMQQAVPLGLGAMAAIVGLSDEQVKQLCLEASKGANQVTAANFNALGQVVVAGHAAAVSTLINLANDAGARLAKIIPVSVPCHCPLLFEASELFAQSLSQVDFKNPLIDVISNVDLSIYHSAAHIKNKLKEQLYSPVQWVATIQLFKARQVELILECGPGKVLQGLIKRIDRSLTTESVGDKASLDQVLEQLLVPA